MVEKRECKIVQDLLPTYIEKLTSEETNEFIEEHLKGCNECKNVLEDMKKDLTENNNSRIDGKEVNYIKKFNMRLRLFRNILLIIILLFIVIVGRKTFILTSLSNKAKSTINKTNYYTKTETFANGQMSILESYNKDGITYGTMNVYSNINNNIKMTMYKSEKEIINLIDNGETKTWSNIGDITIVPVYFTGENIVENVFMAFTTSLDKIELNGKKCYIIRENNEEKFIDVNTGLAIKMIDNENNRTTDYKYEFGIVKDEDIARPDTSDYVKVE